MGQRRIKFYSVNDMGTGWHLQKMEAFFQDWDILTDNPDVNTILELFNIKKFLDADVRLVQWSDLQLEEYKEKGRGIPQILGKFSSELSDANLVEMCNMVESIYADDFWTLLCENKVYKHQ